MLTKQRSCVKLEFKLSIDISPRRQLTNIPSRYQNEVQLTETIGNSRRNNVNDLELFLRTEIYYPTVDKSLAELERRFSSENITIFKAVGELNPCSNKFLDNDTFLTLACHYNANIGNFLVELQQINRMIERKELDGIMPNLKNDKNKLTAFAGFVSEYRDAFYELNRILRIACTLSVTFAEAERSFSCLKLIKTHLHTTMLDKRLSNLSILSIHSAKAKELEFRRCYK